ncbi:MAG: autotransporter-associated beta strand repeat-containing protein [Verrucomicrobiota bacterium]
MKTKNILSLAALLLIAASTARATSQTYTMQTGNFATPLFNTSSGAFTGFANNGATEVHLWANGGSGQDNTTVYQNLNVSGSQGATARALQVGDQFSLTMYSANHPFGFVGVYFNDNTSYSSWSNYNTNERTAVVLGSSGNWIIENNGTSVDTGIANGISITIGMTVTSSASFNISITNNNTSATTTYYDLVMKNAPGTTAHIQSFALADQNDNAGDFYVKNGSLSNTGAVNIGNSNLNTTYGGVISDGLAANSASTVSANSLVKSGTGITTLSATNTYTGSTTISQGTLSISADSNLGTAPGSATAGSITFLNNFSALQTTANFTLNANRGITLSSGQIDFFGIAASTTLTYNGVIAGSGGLVKNQSGTLALGGNNTWTGGLYIDNGTVNLSGSIAASQVDVGTAGTDTASDAAFNLSAAGGQTVSQNINVQTNTGAGHRTINFNNTSGTAILSGTVTLNKTATFSNATANASITGIATGAGGLTKSGAGTLTLTATNTYTGATTVSAGKLVVSGRLSSSSTSTVAVGATLASGNNTTSSVGAVSVSSDGVGGGTLAPGDTTGFGKLTVNGGLTLGTASSAGKAHLAIEIGNTTAGTGYDQIAVSGGAATLNPVNLDITLNGYVANSHNATFSGGTLQLNGDVFYLVIGSTGVSGTFANTQTGNTFTGNYTTVSAGGQLFAVSYSATAGVSFNNGGHDIALMAIPEPSTWASILVGSAFLVSYRRRRTRLS